MILRMIKKLFAYNNSDKERRIFDKKSDATKNFSIEHCFVGSIGISSTIDDDEKLYAVSKIDNEGGYLLYGPYKSYLPGQYQAVFTFKNFSKLKNNTIKIDIAYKGGEILSERSIQGSDLAVSPKQTIKFLLAQPEDNIEFRVFIGKGIELAVCRDVEVLSVSNSFQNFFGDIPNQYYTDFIKKHLNVLLALIRLGGKFYFKEERLLFESEDMIFVVQDEGDLTVMREIFLDVAYGLFHNFDAVAIDIGMNVGFVSLSLARNKHIKYIYSYEPFKQTYDRAIYNFNLNPKLSTKIKHYNFCVWNDCAEFNVKYDSKQSIGMSIKNNANDIEVDGGGGERIKTLRADKIFVDIIQRHNNLPIIVKIDCEGSEFAILQQLDEANLFNNIKVIIMEWHKWWDPNLSNVNIRQILLKNNFIIFDFDQRLNAFASMIYAVKN